MGEAANRRHVIGLSPTLWMIACAAAVAIICALTHRYAARLGAYRTGIITVEAFALTALYSARKHALWVLFDGSDSRRECHGESPGGWSC